VENKRNGAKNHWIGCLTTISLLNEGRKRNDCFNRFWKNWKSYVHKQKRLKKKVNGKKSGHVSHLS
jgi:hypothetical protein